jgi:hypothetical protein
MFNFAKLVSRYFKVKFGPDFGTYKKFSKLVKSDTNFTDFARVKFDFTDLEFLVRFNTYLLVKL